MDSHRDSIRQGTTISAAGPPRRFARRDVSSDATFDELFDHAPIGLALTDAEPGEDRRFLRVNGALAEIAGLSQAELTGKSVEEVLAPDEVRSERQLFESLLSGALPRYTVQRRWRRRHGPPAWALMDVSIVRDDGGEALYGVMQVQDETDRRRFEGELTRLADHDPITGLFNRRRFEDELRSQLAYTARYGRGGALLTVGLDHLQFVNDTLGRAVGDDLIGCVGALLRGLVWDTDVVARIGGDQFAILLHEVDEAAASGVAGKILDAVRTRTVAPGRECPVRATASIGVAPFAADARPSAEELLSRADVAMRRAKAAGRDRLEVVHRCDDTHAATRTRMALSQRIRDALAEDGFELFRQPIVELGSGKLERHELLLRMRGADGKLIAPGGFLGVAADFGLVRAIDEWVVRRAIAYLAEERAAGRSPSVAVNLAGASIGDPWLLEVVEHELGRSPAAPGQLLFEVTETTPIVDFDQARRFAERSAELGCAFALDDFGAGFGSFHYLKHLPFEYVKIDGDFVRYLPESEHDRLTVQAIVQVVHSLGKRAIAEFVEDEPTLRLLKGYGVDFVQGYFIGRPEPLRGK